MLFRSLSRLAGKTERHARIVRMTDYLQRLEAGFVPDPYYGGAQDFEHVLDLLEDAADGLLDRTR